jgi:hypothetical protein
MMALPIDLFTNLSFPRNRESIPLSLRAFKESAAISFLKPITENFSSKKEGFSQPFVEYIKEY